MRFSSINVLWCDPFGEDPHPVQQVVQIFGLEQAQRVLQARPPVRFEVLHHGVRAPGNALGHPRGRRAQGRRLIRLLDAEVEGVGDGRAGLAARELPQHGNVGSNAIQVKDHGQPAAAVLRRAADGSRRVAPDPDRRPTVGWVRRHADPIDAVELAVVAGDRLAPQHLHQLDRFVGHHSAVREIGAQQGELLWIYSWP